MKKKMILLALVAVVMSTSIFATPIDNNISSNVLSSFSSKFDGAKEVSWSSTEDYTKASFILNNQYMFAYFTNEGKLIGVARNLVSGQLPLNLQAELKRYAENGWITELFEFATDSETSFFVTIENADQKILLKSAVYNTWSVYRKTKKS